MGSNGIRAQLGAPVMQEFDGEGCDWIIAMDDGERTIGSERPDHRGFDLVQGSEVAEGFGVFWTRADGHAFL